MGDADGSTTSSPLATLTFNPKLQLPATCDPPTPQNPPEQRVWIATASLAPAKTKTTTTSETNSRPTSSAPSTSSMPACPTSGPVTLTLALPPPTTRDIKIQMTKKKKKKKKEEKRKKNR
ncbi:MAG: hypothetical protein LQ352_005083 [Teloschistes flavicans]|nr:MAG: hypothetical protein LQ352_005083 [Teloschistes flavicans]